MKKHIEIILPVYNEEESLPNVFERLKKLSKANSNYSWSFLFVNDGSSDKSIFLIKDICQKEEIFRYISFSRNFGHQAAVSAGVASANGDYIGIIDADLQDPPELFVEMARELDSGINLVYGTRKKRAGETWFKLFTAKMFYILLDKLSGVNIPRDTGDFRLFDKKVQNAFLKMPEYHRFIRGMIAWVGFKSKPLHYDRVERFAGETKYPLWKMLKFALDGIFSFSNSPLKIANYIGTFTIFLGILGLIYIVCLRLFFDIYITGTSTVLFFVLFIGGTQLLCIGIIGEYVGRIYEESKRRPLYIIEDKDLEEELNK